MARSQTSNIPRPAQIGVVIPGYNEAKRIGSVLSDLVALARLFPSYGFHLIVVDDGSHDETSSVVRSHQDSMPASMRLHVLRHDTNLGKGGAASTGCEAARLLGVDMMVLMDADGQHRAEDVARLIHRHQELATPALIIGSRPLSGDMPFMMRFGNRFLTGATRALFRIAVHDSQSGLRAFPASIYPRIRWASAQYAMETEMLIMAQSSGVMLVEVPIETVYHDNHKGTTPLDGLRVLRTLIEWRFFRSPLRHLAAAEASYRAL